MSMNVKKRERKDTRAPTPKVRKRKNRKIRRLKLKARKRRNRREGGKKIIRQSRVVQMILMNK